MNDSDEKWNDFLFNLKFWSAVTCAGLVVWGLVEVFV